MLRLKKDDRISIKSDEWRTNVSSGGETEQLEKMQDEWYRLYKNADSTQDAERWTYEQVIENPRPFLEEIKKLKVIPPYKYVINYILMRTRLAIGENNLEGFVEFIKSKKMPDDRQGISSETLKNLLERKEGELLRPFTENDYRTVWYAMLDRLDIFFDENGYDSEINWKSFFNNCVKKFDYDKLFWLALGMHMSVVDFEIFLCKVLKRRQYNFYNRKEVFLYLTLKYGDVYGTRKYFQAYERLCALYKDSKIRKISDDGERINVLDIKVKALTPDILFRKWVADGQVEIPENDTKVVTPSFLHSIHSEICLVKTDTGHIRDERLEALAEKIVYIQAGENLLFADQQYGKKAETGILHIYFRDTVFIPRGTVFEFSAGKKKFRYECMEDARFEEDGATNIIRRDLDLLVENHTTRDLFEENNKEIQSFLNRIEIRGKHIESGNILRTAEKTFDSLWKSLQRSQKDEILAMIKDEYASDKRTVLEVRVKSVLPDAVYQKKLSEKKQLRFGKNIRFLTDELLETMHACVALDFDDVENQKKNFLLDTQISNIHVGENVRMSAGDGMTDQGIFKIYCREKTVIPKGTRFKVDLGDVCLRYESLETVQARKEIRKLKVRYDYRKEAVIPKGLLLETETLVPSADNERRALFRVTEKKILYPQQKVAVEIPVRALMPEKAFKKIQKQLGDQLGNASFVKNKFLQEKGIEIKIIDEKLADAVSGIDVGSGVRYAEAPSNRGNLMVTCDVGTCIPKGTGFAFTLDGHRFTYESIEDGNISSVRVPVTPGRQWTANAGFKPNDCLPKKASLKITHMDPDGKGVLGAVVEKVNTCGLFKERRQKNWITVICEKACKIPGGTVFTWESEGQIFEFTSDDDVTMCPYLEDEIEVEWVNADSFQKAAASENGTEFVEADTVFSSEIPGVYKIYTAKRMALANISETDQNYNTENIEAMLRYIYDPDGGQAGQIRSYKGFPMYGRDYFLNTKLFKDTYFTRNIFSQMIGDEERIRNFILTLKFLEFVMDPENMDDDYAGFLISDFEAEVDEVMYDCGFQPYYRRGFPYDAFIALLLNCDKPLELFRAVWNSGRLSETKEASVNGKNVSV